MTRNRLPIEGRNRGIARIHAPNLEHRGMGILVSPCLVVTCAHVVNLARGEAQDFQTRPDELMTFTVTFPLVAEPKPVLGRIVAWQPMGGGAVADVAVLELEEEAPVEAGIAVLADIQAQPLDGDRLTVFGFAGQLPFGNHVDTQVMGPAIGGVTQINGGAPPSLFIEKGYSGAGVWSHLHETVIGMVSARLTDPAAGTRVAYMIPAFALREAAALVPMEVRRLPREFNVVWTVVMICWFLLLLNHFLITQGGSPAPDFSLWGEHPQLAAFAGLHIFAFVAPWAFWMLRAHAKALSLHDWSWRVPGFSFIRTRTVGRYRRPLAAATLFMFAAVPLYAHAHFLRKFHNEGTVFAYANDFGQVTPPEKCLPGNDDNRLCELEGAGRYSLAEVQNKAAGGYWNNHYRYGEDHPGDRDTVTFFPILQPVILEILTFLALLLLVSGLNRVFGPWRYLNWLERDFSALSREK